MVTARGKDIHRRRESGTGKKERRGKEREGRE
jgi:hypothetical protein